MEVNVIEIHIQYFNIMLWDRW